MSEHFRILHCLRAPVGGLFRHVRDLASAQTDRGHAVGLICDSLTGGADAESALQELSPRMELGVTRLPMPRLPGPGDIAAVMRTRQIAGEHLPSILHGHGAKGGAYARIAASGRRGSTDNPLACLYTPHGGSLHYAPSSLAGRMFHALERRLEPRTSGLIFESAYSARLYRERIRIPSCPVRVIPNGLHEAEFADLHLAANATDFLFIGELRQLKGVDVMLEALARLARQGRDVTATIVGAGPDEARFRSLAAQLDLESQVRFPGAMPARTAFVRGGCLIVPSRAESFPYIVLEAAAANMPMIATHVGGIPEIFGGQKDALIPPDDIDVLAARMAQFLDNAGPFARDAETLRKSVHDRFTVELMAEAVLGFYGELLEGRAK